MLRTMKLANNLEANPRGQSMSPIKMVIVYETAGAAIHAKEMSEQLALELQSECVSWPMDLLAQAAVGRRAATAAAEADMIIIAALGAGELPGYVRNWIESWLPLRKTGPTALVVLLDENGETLPDPPPCCSYLREVAERGKMDFFCSASQWTLRDYSRTNEITHGNATVAVERVSRPEPIWLECGTPD
jgi:hypothetical protein